MDCSWETTNFLSEQIHSLPPELVTILQDGTNTAYLDALAHAALQPSLTESILCHFGRLIPEIAARWQSSATTLPSLLGAFGRILAHAPYMTQVAEVLIRKRCKDGDVIQAVLKASATPPREVDDRMMGEALLGLLRLLDSNNDVFAQFIRPARLQGLLSHRDQSIRFLALRVLCLYMHASDTVFETLVSRYIIAGDHGPHYDGLSIDFAFYPLWERRRISKLKQRLEHARNVCTEHHGPTQGKSRVLTPNDFSPEIANILGVLIPRAEKSHEAAQHSSDAMVPTASSAQNARLLAHALLQDSPILVTGAPGSGKTFLINQLAHQLGRSPSMITLHLNDQSDAKLLVGIYTTGSRPDAFEWHPGVLTTAVQEGRWVLIEDLDRAPKEIISTLIPLLERRELRIPGRERVLKAAGGFRILATMRSHMNLQGHESTPDDRMLGGRLWRRLRFQEMKLSESKDIAIAKYHLLPNLMDRMVEAFSRLQKETSAARLSPRLRSSLSRPISSRDLFKWCSRIEASINAAGFEGSAVIISDNFLDAMFLDGMDCFGASLQQGELKELIASCLAQELHIDPQRKAHLLATRNPQITTRSTEQGQSVTAGRAKIAGPSRHHVHGQQTARVPYALTGQSRRLLEQISVAIQRKEPLLLVGETGIGKTASIQHLSQMSGHRLLAVNLSQQSESGDLLGGYKPVSIRTFALPLKEEFDTLFNQSFSYKKNQKFLDMLNKSIAKAQWRRAISLWKEALKMVDKTSTNGQADASSKRSETGEQLSKRRKVDQSVEVSPNEAWTAFAAKVEALERRVTASSNSFAFSFVEGTLVKAVREGYWILLDEINLASADTLECIADLLDVDAKGNSSLLLTETGSAERVNAHSNFRLFAAMNPATDVGKKDLPLSIRSRFTELYVTSADQDIQSLRSIAEVYICRASSGAQERQLCIAATDIYRDIQAQVNNGSLVDGAGERPQFSLRTFTRAMTHASTIVAFCSLRRAIYEGFCMCFSTCLKSDCEEALQQLLKGKLFTSKQSAQSELKKPLRLSSDDKNELAIKLQIQAIEKGSKPTTEMHWLMKGVNAAMDPEEYIITPYIGRNLRNLIRAASSRKYPVLIQGPTSAGKTSMIDYLAQRSGNEFVRINNHEHTDLQEYLGTYVSNSDGQIVFQEGALVRALRQGHWLVLDELNLAPTDVLEALNRLLDDNRELFIPETQEVVRPHPNFMLFATQNPAGAYGGRKTLSRAFRNRFLELHFDDIPVVELNVILSRRSALPESWCGLIVDVYKRLAQLRQETRLFDQNSFATLRDLFRWAYRGADTVETLAKNGYMLLAEKVRKPEERLFIKETIEQVVNRKGVRLRLDDQDLYSNSVLQQQLGSGNSNSTQVVWTKAMRRLYILVSQAIQHNEPVLLVGETGCGKTTVCQMIASATARKLFTVNAHQNMETSDLIGAQRPNRHRHSSGEQLRQDLIKVLTSAGLHGNIESHGTNHLLKLLDNVDETTLSTDDKELLPRIQRNRAISQALFEWHDGSLIQAMRTGQYFLLDEISLAEDSVLERMNSVLDPQRSILLAEKATVDSNVVAESGFQLFATMNPGGDFGKKELSPALRNRFTEIWVPPMDDMSDILSIAGGKLHPACAQYADVVVSFATWFRQRYSSSKDLSISLRDILTWVNFINTSPNSGSDAIFNGALSVFVDSLGANPSGLVALAVMDLAYERRTCVEKLASMLGMESPEEDGPISLISGQGKFQIGGYSISTTSNASSDDSFNFETKTTRRNAMKIIRALQHSKPILLEGDPGVGKTSIVSAIAKTTGHSLTRLNLSEQTDLMDLFGSDVPVEGAAPGTFAWRDAPFLTAMKTGGWVLLDEMNLASQSVLEGLNACIDHRSEAYISELDMTFSAHADFRLFAAQNPHHQGGGRKGLPASFVNRFTVVYADTFEQDDLALICSRYVPNVGQELIMHLVHFVSTLTNEVAMKKGFGSSGSPWEFNLRDTLRSLQLLASQQGLLSAGDPQTFLDILFTQRFRSSADRTACAQLINDRFGGATYPRSLFTGLTVQDLQVGVGSLQRADGIFAMHAPTGVSLAKQNRILESLIICVQNRWPAVLIGPSGAGKSYALQTLAALAGAELETLPVSADMDANDLIGAYEQGDPSRKSDVLLNDVRAWARIVLRQCVEHADGSNQHALEPLLIELTAHKSLDLGALRINLVTIEKALHIDDHAGRYFESLIPQLRNFCTECDVLLSQSNVNNAARFEWIDGTIIKALEKGQWLVLDNANLCSSSVLDRLNSLLEPNGFLIINEHCEKDGTPRMIKPHPNFRIFLTLDPQYGEISRAMRNRAVELFLPSRAQEEEIQLDTTESTMYPYDKLLCLLRHVSPGTTNASFIIENGFMGLPLKSLHRLQSFLEQCQLGLSELCLVDLLLKAYRSFEYLLKHFAPLLQSVTRFYQFKNEQNASTDLKEQCQLIDVLSNQPLVLLHHDDTSFNHAKWLSGISETAMQVAKMEEALFGALKTAGPNVQHTQLQKSAAMSRKTRSSDNPALRLASFLEDVKHSLTKWVNAAAQSSLFDLPSISFVSRIISFWWSFLALADQPTLDRAELRAYFQIAQTQLQEVGFQNTPSQQLVTRLAARFAEMVPSSNSSSGLSLERLWLVFKPHTADSLERLQVYTRVLQAAKSFDAMTWTAQTSLRDLSSLQQSIISMGRLALDTRSSISAMLQDVEAVNVELTKPRDESGSRTKPHFTSTFEALCRNRDLKTLEKPDTTLHPSHDLSMWTLLAQRRTDDQIKCILDESPAGLLNSLASYTGSDSIQKGPSMQDIAQEILPQVIKSGDVPVRRLSLLKEETKILGLAVSRHTDILCSDHKSALRNHLSALMRAVFVAHSDIIENPSSQDLNSLSERPSESVEIEELSRLASEIQIKPSIDGRQHLEAIFKQWFSMPFSDGPEQTISSLAFAFIKFAIGCMTLFIPDQASDPVLRSLVERRLHQHNLDGLRVQLSAAVETEKILHGHDESLKAGVFKHQISALGEAPQAQAIARPVVSRLLELQAELENAMRLKTRIVQASSQEQLKALAEGNLTVDISETIRRLDERFIDYRDISEPVIGFLTCLRLGLELLRSKTTRSSSNSSAMVLATFLPLREATRPIWTHVGYSDSAFQIENASRQPSVLLKVLDGYSFRAGVQPIKKWPVPTKELLSNTLDALYFHWKERLQSDREENVAKSSLYQYRGGQDRETEEDEQEFEDLFPSYESSLPEDEKDGKKNNRDTVDITTLTSSVAKLHMNILRPSASGAEVLLGLLKDSHDTSIASKSETQEAHNQAQRAYPTLLLKMWKLSQDLESKPTNAKQYNIYNDPNLTEVNRLSALVSLVLERLEPIITTWPEHATLHNISNTCHKLLEFRHIEPIAKFLTKVEQLHGYVAEWQTVASREFSLGDVQQNITALLVSWRQLELSTWARLLDLETEKSNTEAMSWWFVAYESIILASSSLQGTEADQQSHTVELTKTVEALLRSSTIGQFSTRLDILKAFQMHLDVLSGPGTTSQMISSALGNMLTHFDRFRTKVQDQIAQGRTKLEKEVRSVIQLASWKDTNISALKQSAKASHRKLFKTVRKYRELLRQPVALSADSTSIDGQESPSEDQVLQASAVELSDAQVLDLCETSIATWRKRPARFKSLSRTAYAMFELYRNGQLTTFSTSSYLDDFTATVEASAKHLRNATPSVLNEETKAAVKHLTTQKRRLVADTLKDMRKMGLRNRQSPNTISNQADLATVIARMPRFEHFEHVDGLKTANLLLHAVLDRMGQVRSFTREHSEDIEQSEITRCTGMLEGTLSLSLSQRRNIFASSKTLDILESTTQKVKNLSTKGGSEVSYETNQSFSFSTSCEGVLTWLPTIMQATVQVLEAQAALGQIDFSDLLNEMRQWTQDLNTSRHHLEHKLDMPSGLAHSESKMLAVTASSQVTDLEQRIRLWMTAFPQASPVLQHLFTWTGATSTPAFDPNDMQNLGDGKTVDPEEYCSEILSFLDDILVALQDVSKAQQNFPASQEEDSWLLQAVSAQQAVIAGFRLPSITRRLSDTLEKLQYIKADETSRSLQVCSTLTTLMLPVIHEYTTLARDALGKQLTLHSATNRMLYKFSGLFCQIAQNGFCKPAEKSDEQAAGKEKLEAGTGLGEGEGAEDISKDIGDDEDLSELAQEAGDDAKDGDNEMEDNDDAVDVEDNLEGGGASGKKEIEEGDQGDDGQEGSDVEKDIEDQDSQAGEANQEEGDAEDEIGEGVGEVDDLEPSAVDEKFWDEAGDEQNRETEADKQSASNVDKNDQAAGKDRKEKKEKKADEAADDGMSGNEDADEQASMSDEEKPTAQNADIGMDPHVEEAEQLDLPEELNLDGKGDKDEQDQGLDSDEDMLGDAEAGTEDDAELEEEDGEADEAKEHGDENQAEVSKPTENEEEGVETQEDATDEISKEQEDNAKPYAAEDATQGDGPEPDGTAQATEGRNATAGVNEIDEAADDANAQEESASDEAAAKRDNAEQKPSNSAQEGQGGKSQGRADNQASRDRETVKKLGDILEKWHRQRQRIQDKASERDEGQAEQKDVDMADVDFEHLPDEDAEADTQALGAASQDQARALDESAALPSNDTDAPENRDDFAPEVQDDEDGDEDDADIEMGDDKQATATDDVEPATATIGRRNEDQTMSDKEAVDADTEAENVDDVSTDLQTMQIERSPTPPSDPSASPAATWQRHEAATHALSLMLTEQLRLILSPTQATKLRGDHRTGKRLNIKRIIPYIASSYRRDKIWMRRSAPSKRAYQILLAIDDSKSMGENGSADLAFATLALVARSLSMLEAGEVGVVGFGERVFVAHDLGAPLTGAAGADVVARFGFRQGRTDVRRLVTESIALFRDARLRSQAAADLWQLMLIVSDGICEDHDAIRRLLLDAAEERIMIVFVVVDATATAQGIVGGGAVKGKQSIVDLQQVQFVEGPKGDDGADGEMKLVRRQYLDTFPFKYFLIVRDVRDLPDVLSAALRQWFAEVASV